MTAFYWSPPRPLTLLPLVERGIVLLFSGVMDRYRASYPCMSPCQVDGTDTHVAGHLHQSPGFLALPATSMAAGSSAVTAYGFVVLPYVFICYGLQGSNSWQLLGQSLKGYQLRLLSGTVAACCFQSSPPGWLLCWPPVATIRWTYCCQVSRATAQSDLSTTGCMFAIIAPHNGGHHGWQPPLLTKRFVMRAQKLPQWQSFLLLG